MHFIVDEANKRCDSFTFLEHNPEMVDEDGNYKQRRIEKQLKV